MGWADKLDEHRKAKKQEPVAEQPPVKSVEPKPAEIPVKAIEPIKAVEPAIESKPVTEIKAEPVKKIEPTPEIETVESPDIKDIAKEMEHKPQIKHVKQKRSNRSKEKIIALALKYDRLKFRDVMQKLGYTKTSIAWYWCKYKPRPKK